MQAPVIKKVKVKKAVVANQSNQSNQSKQPKKITAAKPITPPVRVCSGAGMTAGLELHQFGTKFVLVDQSKDGKFATDVHTWNAAAGLNTSEIKYIKDATKQDTA